MDTRRTSLGSASDSSLISLDGIDSRELSTKSHLGRNRNPHSEEDRSLNPSPTSLIQKSHAAFVSKLYNMVQDPEIQNLISWSESGDIFRVYSPSAFSRNVLPRYFKHNNWQSFVRQLNMYGFNKVNDMIHSPLRNETQIWEFRHPHFRKGAIENLVHIKRKSIRSLRHGPSMIPASERDVGRTDILVRDITSRVMHVTSSYNTVRSELISLRKMVSDQQEAMRGMVDVLKALMPPVSTTLEANGAEVSYHADRKLLPDKKLLAIETQLQVLSDYSRSVVRSPTYSTLPIEYIHRDEASSSSQALHMYNAMPSTAGSEPFASPRPLSAPVLSTSTSTRFSESDLKTRAISTIMGLGRESPLLNPAPSNKK